MSANVIPPIMRNDPMNTAVHDLTEQVSAREGQKVTLMGLIRNEDTQRVVGVATFLLMILTAILFGTLLSDIRNDIKAIRIETTGNTLEVNRLREQIRYIENRIEKIENKIE